MPGVEGDESVVGFVALEELSGSGDGWTAIGADPAMAAVVEDDVTGVAAALIAIDLAHEGGCNLVGGGFFPVIGHRIPRDGDQSELPSQLEGVWSACAEGRTKVADRLAGDLREQIVCSSQFVQNIGRPRAREVGMAPCVIPDQVPGICDAAREFGFRFGKFADHEESGTDIVPGKDVQKARCPPGVWAIVKGKREFSGAPRSRQGPAKDLRSWPMRCVGKRTDGQTGCAGQACCSVNSSC